eukprot:2137201-Rhodomonas_salina.1
MAVKESATGIPLGVDCTPDNSERTCDEVPGALREHAGSTQVRVRDGVRGSFREQRLKTRLHFCVEVDVEHLHVTAQ